MGWFLPLFSFGMLLLLTGSKAEVKEAMNSGGVVICTCPETAASEIPNASLTASTQSEGARAD
jgi:hypothetical protein